MEHSSNEEKRLEIKQRINHILEPMIVDLLIVKPDNPHAFMREWLQTRRDYFEQATQKETRETGKPMKRTGKADRT